VHTHPEVHKFPKTGQHYQKHQYSHRIKSNIYEPSSVVKEDMYIRPCCFKGNLLASALVKDHRTGKPVVMIRGKERLKDVLVLHPSDAPNGDDPRRVINPYLE